MCKDTTSRGKRPPEQAGIKQIHFKKRIKLQAKGDVTGRCLAGCISKAVLEAPLQTKGWQNPGALCPVCQLHPSTRSWQRGAGEREGR